MAQQIYFEDIEVGYELAPVEKHPTTQQLVKYAGASGDYYQIHYDKDFALANGLPGVILHGALKNAFLGQLMTDFAGDRRMAAQTLGPIPRDGPARAYGHREGQGDQKARGRQRPRRRVRDLAGE